MAKPHNKKQPAIHDESPAIYGRGDRIRKRNIALCILWEPCKTLGFMRFLLLFRKHQSVSFGVYLPG